MTNEEKIRRLRNLVGQTEATAATVDPQTVFQPSTVTVELRAGWPMYVGVLLADRTIVWRSSVGRCRDTEALADADDALDAVSAELLRERGEAA